MSRTLGSGTMSKSSSALLERTKVPGDVAKKVGQPYGGRGGFMLRNKTVGQVVGTNASEATAILLQKEKAVKDLEAQITADEKALKDMDRNIEFMILDRDKLGRKIREEEIIVDAMSPDRELGKRMQDFQRFTTDVDGAYQGLRKTHAGAIDILKTEFDYHPAYKQGRPRNMRGKDKLPFKGENEFSSAYYSMHPHPDRMHPT